MTDKTQIAEISLTVTQSGGTAPQVDYTAKGDFEAYFYAFAELINELEFRRAIIAAVIDWAINSGYFELRKAAEAALSSDIIAHHEVWEKAPQTPPDVILDAKMWNSSGEVQLNFVGVGDTETLTDFFRFTVFDERVHRYTLLAAASYIEDSDPILWRPLANSIKAFVASDLLGAFEGNQQKTEIKINELI